MDLVKSILEENEGKEDLSKSTKVHKNVELDVDLGTLLASDYNALDAKALNSVKKIFKWIPTYGYKRVNAQEQKEWLMEVKGDTSLTDDLFAKEKTAKQERQSKNELQRLRNIAKSRNIKLPRVGLPTREHFPNSQQLSEALTVARTSTASIGKFQFRLPKEKDAKGIAKEITRMKKKRKAPPLSFIEEKLRNKNLLDSILKSNTKIIRDDYSRGITEIKQSTTSGNKKRKGALKASKTAKKPKAGKGKRDLHQKVGGRKRR
ncbi:Ribosome biogenesis regulatory protein like protein [Trachymyrmex zeteki]|uniref:Ribosome biogenesis regulatory protein n=1 Tax=Mycetomoellerius zeteki TaxID=64791 RepID=A0A151WW73_9HYME|nr:Ribosome biogenesis regulatory protein like protein [Trachymyrmex zeteki]